MLDSINALTHEHLQLGEGVLLRGVDLDRIARSGSPGKALAETMQDTSCLIGATKEGCVFRCMPQMIDTTRGKRTPAAGEVISGRWEISLSGTLLEMTPANAALLLNLEADQEAELTPAPFTMGGGNICWIGTMGSGLLAIELRSVVSTGGVRFRTGYGGMGETPFTLMAMKDDPASKALPCRMLWLKEAEE